MSDLLIGGLVMAGVFTCVAFAASSLLALLLRKLRPALSPNRVILFSAAPMPVLAMIALLAMLLTPIGVDDNGPQISGGLIITIGLIFVAAFGYVLGSLSARWTLGKIRDQ